MDKKERVMSKMFIFFLLAGMVFLSSGCQTISGIGKGIAVGVTSAAEGLSKDTRQLWNSILKADSWVKENLW